jgi:hypothetical protein
LPGGKIVHLHELVEERRNFIRRYADAGVPYREAQRHGPVAAIVAFDERDVDAHLAFPGEFDRVACEVDEYLPKASGIAL